MHVFFDIYYKTGTQLTHRQEEVYIGIRAQVLQYFCGYVIAMDRWLNMKLHKKFYI